MRELPVVNERMTLFLQFFLAVTCLVMINGGQYPDLVMPLPVLMMTEVKPVFYRIVLRV